MYGTDTDTAYFCNKNGGGGTNNACKSRSLPPFCLTCRSSPLLRPYAGCCNSVTFAMLQACI